MSEANGADVVELVAEEVKDIKLENGSAPGAGASNGTPGAKEDNAIPFKVRITFYLTLMSHVSAW